MAYVKPPYSMKLPISQLFIDAVDIKIFAGNVRRPHGKEGNGYQRDPYIRIRWIKQRVEKFDIKLCRPVEVSKRDDGTYALMDGGGRWLLSQLAKRTEIECRVHDNLTREKEAELFFNFDREIYRLRAVDTYLAALRAGHPVIGQIDEALTPYRVSKRGGAATFDGVGTLYDIYHCRGANLIRRTSLVTANTWGGLKKGGEFTGDRIVPGYLFGTVALLLDTNPKAEANVRLVLKREDYSPKKLAAKVEKRLKGTKSTSMERLLIAAEIIAQRANAEGEGHNPIDLRDLRSSTLFEAFEQRAGTKLAFGSQVAADADEAEAA